MLNIKVSAVAGLTSQLTTALGAICDQAEEHPAVVMLQILGGDSTGPLPDVSLLTKWEGVLRRLERLPAASFAVMRGRCAGVALDAALAADYRIAVPGTQLRTKVSSNDVWPGMALYRVGRLSQHSLARQAVLFGRPLGTDDALVAGLVDEVAEVPAIDTAGRQLVEGLTGRWGPDLAIRRDLLRGAVAEFEEALGGHVAACDRLLRRQTDSASARS
ncbi:enoyl-CoA-hydratase DpgB [Streptomyces sp. NPDC059783]|uniref:enoyl-CoA-hydratase DpgB n=1 Tax=Streptomyces sp. NPDC059783 TaxID=3346944 RepID=UPI00366759C8